MGAFPNLYGLGADGIKNFEVLLADGRLINANANENGDLYRALKGGGSNFRIVTRFGIETHPLINVQYTINLYNPEDYVEIIKATIAVQETIEDDPKIGLFTNFNHGFVAVSLLYGDTPAQSPLAFEPFYNLTSLITTVVPATNAISTVTTKVSRELYEEAYKSWIETSKSLPVGCVLHFTIQPMGKAGVQAGKDRGENILGLESVPQCWWVFTCEWPKDGSDDAAAQKAVDSSQKVLRSYGTENVKRMQDVAVKYDPEGIFQKLQHNGFLLRNTSEYLS
ncbi:hypothetical protein TSTA_067660 [Talaromyces stipitatus ATCC 10500]|uniref:FAD-binding PCMH-type domain-containing protein n=1 Tax=Talaromyces stipitatus (strain ATCC 10500 / CBS 375.48 / QM 6759 / NRRL 1006) TaxID=441959 RepID=B8LY89_TALSN|nr:uncharacterized protein TSTA_067660 [Talaromyces stipitatus ATCC 10500]EED23334.1 hypothetical protein TSTA_067660 [Talaromyces stipitatus ATCC 10500]